MESFFNVMEIDQVFRFISRFTKTAKESITITDAQNPSGRVLADDVASDEDIPGFDRSTMDGYAVAAASTFGAGETNPAYLSIKGSVDMGVVPDFTIGPGECAEIPTGGMLPEGSDSIVMVEYTNVMDDTMIEVLKAVAPGQNVIRKGDDLHRGEILLAAGTRMRPQEIGLLAAMGKTRIVVYKKPQVAIISTGNEIVPVNKKPGIGEIRDVNSHTIAAQVREAGGIPVSYGIVKDDFAQMMDTLSLAHSQSDMVLISGGSSVGARDFTTKAIEKLPDSGILVHGITISPGKPTIIAEAAGKPVMGLPGHAVSAMVVFSVVVKPFLNHISGIRENDGRTTKPKAVLSRNIASPLGRQDYVRVKITHENGVVKAHPIPGKSGLISTMVKADGLVVIPMNSEGLDQGAEVEVLPL